MFTAYKKQVTMRFPTFYYVRIVRIKIHSINVLKPKNFFYSAHSNVFPLLYGAKEISEDQVYDGLFFIGKSYKKYIELFNHQYAKQFERNLSTAYFDCTNFYFEIDLPREDLQKGPSKENRHDPIIGQALLLDSDLVPLGMEMYPGNESEKPHIRKMIEEMKQRYHVTGKTIQIADKGLNCARNIYAAVKEANDGYIFSKAIRGKALSGTEKQWLLLENDKNKFTDHYDGNGRLLYRLKFSIEDFTYEFVDVDPETGEKTVTTFTVKEKRVVSYNPLQKSSWRKSGRWQKKRATVSLTKRWLGRSLGTARST